MSSRIITSAITGGVVNLLSIDLHSLATVMIRLVPGKHSTSKKHLAAELDNTDRNRTSGAQSIWLNINSEAEVMLDVVSTAHGSVVEPGTY